MTMGDGKMGERAGGDDVGLVNVGVNREVHPRLISTGGIYGFSHPGQGEGRG